jgi:peptidoglycan/LPS O-acetylase OafA/YrhL
MTFYAFAPFLMLLLEKKITYLTLFLFTLFGFTVLLGNLLPLLTGNIDYYFFPADFVLMSTFAGQSIFFIAGMSIVKYDFFWEKLSFNKYLTTIGALGFITTLYVIGCFQETRLEHGTNHWQGKLMLFIMLPAFIVLLFKGLISESTYLQRFLSSKIMVLLGKASFAFYLIHISYINLKIKSFVLFGDRNFILLWLVSIALYYGFEKPIYDWFLKRYLNQKFIKIN